MTRKIVLTVGAMAALALLSCTLAGQFPVSIPKIPKITKVKPDAPAPPETGNSSTKASGGSNETSASNASEDPDIWENVHPALYSDRDNIKEARKAVEAYTPQTKTRIVPIEGYDWLLRAVSASERKKFYDDWGKGMPPRNKVWFEAQFDAIAKAAAVKLPLFVPGGNAYTIRNPAEERMMKDQLSSISSPVIYKIGLDKAVWTIESNSIGIPIHRFKYGMIWGRSPSSDHPYCWFWYVNVIQDYAGGGTYGASYGSWVDSQLAGCPAAK